MAVPEMPPPSLIFDYASIDAEDPVDMDMSAAYKQLMDSFSGKTEMEIHNQLQESASISMPKHAEIINGLLYGIFTHHPNHQNPSFVQHHNIPQGAPSTIYSAQDLFRHMNFVARDSLSFAVKQTRHFCSHINFHKIRSSVKEQLVWLVGQLTEIRVQGVELLYQILLRQIRGGDPSPANIQHAEAMLRLLQAHLVWVYGTQNLVPYSCFTYLRIMLDHGRFTNLRQQEAVFCAKLLREKFRDCCDVGRDLIRALQDVARIKEIEEIWVDLLRHPEKLNPQLEGVHQLMAMPTRDIYLASRLTFDIEHKLLYILKNVISGHHHRQLQWFIDRFLAAPEADALFCDVIRYICGVYHPTNAVLASQIVPRYVLIGGLLRQIKSNVAASNVKLALFYDWLFYDPSKDNIMNIEPAMLLMERSVDKYPYMTAILLEFLHFTVENYHPPQRDYIHQHVGMAGQALVDKGVIRSWRNIYRNPSLDDYSPVREYMLSMFPKHLADIIEANASNQASATTSSSDNLSEPVSPRTNGQGRPADRSSGDDSMDEFEGSPQRSTFASQGVAGQDSGDDYEDSVKSAATGTKSRDQSRESSREPMQVDEPASAPVPEEEDDEEGGEDEVMESSSVSTAAPKPAPISTPKAAPEPMLADWGFNVESTSASKSTGSDDGVSAATPVPGASLWIFGSSLPEFKKAYENDPDNSEVADMFRHIWDVYGDVAGAGVEGSDIANEIGHEICAFAAKADIPETYLSHRIRKVKSASVSLPSSSASSSAGDMNTDGDEDAGVMEPLVACLWRVTERDGKDGARRVAQVFLKSEALVDPSERLLGMWYLLGLARGLQQRSATPATGGSHGSIITIEDAIGLYGDYLNVSAAQDKAGAGDDSAEELRAIAQDYLIRDLQHLQDRQPTAFDPVLILALKYLPGYVPRTEAFLRLTLSMATPAQIYTLSLGLSRGDYTLLCNRKPTLSDATSFTKNQKAGNQNSKKGAKKASVKSEQEEDFVVLGSKSKSWEPQVTADVQQVLGSTLEWDTYEQLGVWQMAVSELGGASEAVSELLKASWVPALDRTTRAEAMSGLLNLVRSVSSTPPSIQLARTMVRIIVSRSDPELQSGSELASEDMAEFCESVVIHWAQLFPEQVSQLLVSLSDKGATPVQGGEQADNGARSGSSSKTKLTPKQRKEQVLHLRTALGLLHGWWDDLVEKEQGSESKARTTFSTVWTSETRTSVQDALAEISGAGELDAWPREWWIKEDDDELDDRTGLSSTAAVRRKKSGKRDVESEDEDEKENSDDGKESEGGDGTDDDRAMEVDPHPKRETRSRTEEDEEAEREERRSSTTLSLRDRFGDKKGTASPIRKNSPKVTPSTFPSSSSRRESATAATVSVGVLNSKSKGKKAPVSTTTTRSTATSAAAAASASAQRGASKRKKRYSDDEDDEDDDDKDDDEDEDEEEEEEEEEEDDDDDDEDVGTSRGSKSRSTSNSKTTAKRSSRSKAAAVSRSKAKPAAKNLRSKKRTDKDDDEEEEEEEKEEVDSEEEAQDEEDEEEDDLDKKGSDEDEEDDEDDEEDQEEEQKGKLPLYSQRKAAASANSKLLAKSSPSSSNSSSGSPPGSSKSKTAASRSRNKPKRRLPSDDDE